MPDILKNNLFATGGSKIQLNRNIYTLVVEPGMGYNIKLGSDVSLQPAVSFPFCAGATLGKNVPVKAGVSLQVKF